MALVSITVSAQRLCGVEAYRSSLLQNDPSLLELFDAAEMQIKNTLQQTSPLTQRDTFANEIINIPVVVHVLYNTPAQNISDAQIQSQLTALNKDFNNQNTDRALRPSVFDHFAAEVRIRFCLARVTPDGMATKGIIRKQTAVAVFSADDAVKNKMRGGDDPWDCKRYLNIWVCNLGERMLGYASLPGGPANVDGVVIGFDVFGTVGNLRSQFNKGRTLTHEVGHWLGAKHIWGDTDCGNDEVDDTPRQQSYNFGCRSFPHVTECSENAYGDMFMNFMDFSDDACMNMFTVGQKKRMRALFANGNMRNSFLTSLACDSNLVQAGPVAGDTLTATPEVKKNTFKIFPNPVNTFLIVEYKPAAQLITQPFTLYNMMGVKVLTGNLVKEKTLLNMAHITPGLYIIRIGEGKESVAIKMVRP